MIWFAIETCGLMLATYLVGCVGGCWLRRSCTRRQA